MFEYFGNEFCFFTDVGELCALICITFPFLHFLFCFIEFFKDGDIIVIDM